MIMYIVLIDSFKYEYEKQFHVYMSVPFFPEIRIRFLKSAKSQQRMQIDTDILM